jgi:hypothetical protein
MEHYNEVGYIVMKVKDESNKLLCIVQSEQEGEIQ